MPTPDRKPYRPARAACIALATAAVAVALSTPAALPAAPTTQPATQPSTQPATQPSTQPSTQPAPEALDDMLEAHGLDRFDEVSQLTFTFVAGSGDKATRRAWKWNPQTGDVTLTTANDKGEDEVVTYNRNNMTSDGKQDAKAVGADRRFINDSFWLMPALHAKWAGDSATITDEGQADLPIGEGKGRKIVLKYNDQGGYTPGDTYVLYLDNKNLVAQWSFHRKSAEKGSAMIFDGYETFGPLKIATLRKSSADAQPRLRFEDVSAKTSSER